MFAIILDGFAFLIANLGRILAVFGITAVGAWAVHKYVSQSGSGPGSTPTGGTSILGTANLWAKAAMFIGGAAVAYEIAKDYRSRRGG